ncbi:MAG TPA: GNAT family N-acetyltransferase, partial [Cellvibrionaceae bacterium]|nr:GNAT family N-acetyltransferase [Cellvibrionaceae bacterium]
GAVRIYPVEDDFDALWFGGRLCVARAYRGHQAIGKSLINEAVSRAIDLGCTRFLANVQPQNEAYFQSVHWQTLGAIEVAGRPHVRMQADLSAYPFMPRHPS